jgi:hypothetical protein
VFSASRLGPPTRTEKQNGDHGEEIEDTSAYTSEMIGEDGKKKMDPVELSR